MLADDLIARYSVQTFAHLESKLIYKVFQLPPASFWYWSTETPKSTVISRIFNGKVIKQYIFFILYFQMTQYFHHDEAVVIFDVYPLNIQIVNINNREISFKIT